MQRAILHERMAYSAHQLPPGVPAVFLSLGQIIALVEKRLRWYGFSDWRICDVLCDRQQCVAVKIRGHDGVVLTISLARDCAVPEYGVHAPDALACSTQKSVVARPQAAGSVPHRLVEKARTPQRSDDSVSRVGVMTPNTHRSVQSQISG